MVYLNSHDVIYGTAIITPGIIISNMNIPIYHILLHYSVGIERDILPCAMFEDCII